MAKLVFALLCAAVAVAVARDLPTTTLATLPAQLQQLNARLTSSMSGMASIASTQSSVPTLLDYYYKEDKYEPKYEKKEEYEPKYEKKEYEPKYEKKEYEPKYEKKEYEPKYEKKEYEPKYKHEKEYEPKYEKKEYDSYGYGGKVVVHLHEKHRSAKRVQLTNEDTFQFTSELTCSKAHEDYYAEDGIIGLPIAADHTKIVTVGVCEWTVSKVAEQAVTEKATLKGSTQVVCTFNEEAKEHCENGEVLTKGLTISGQGLVYEFEVAAEDEYKEKAPVTPVKTDVFLSVVNSVVNSKHLKFDNGAIQFFYGKDAESYKPPTDGITGKMTIVFKN